MQMDLTDVVEIVARDGDPVAAVGLDAKAEGFRVVHEPHVVDVAINNLDALELALTGDASGRRADTALLEAEILTIEDAQIADGMHAIDEREFGPVKRRSRCQAA